MLYKYRSLSNMKRVEDIFERKRMYAAKFNKLNDPMEGFYLYNLGQLSQSEVNELYNGKLRYGILSLSATCDNMLMWSHYANEHTGIAICVSIEDERAEVRPVDYVKYDDLTTSFDDGNMASKLLARKLELWAYEKEQRVLILGEQFIGIKIQQLILGIRYSEANRKRIEELRDKHCPDAEIRIMTKEELNIGRLYKTGFLP